MKDTKVVVNLSPGLSTTVPVNRELAGFVDMALKQFVPLSLQGIVDEVFKGTPDDVKANIRAALERRLSAQITRSSANMMAHAVMKQIDGIIDAPDLTGLTQEQKTAIGTQLATQAAHELARAAQALLDYPSYQARVAIAKVTADQTQLIGARAERDAQKTKFNNSLVNVGRLLAGDVPKDQD